MMSGDQTRAALLKASKPPSRELFSTLITANHILHYHNVVDAYGHISVRNPQNPETFFLSKDLAPGLVSNRQDLEEYYVKDASPVNPDAGQGYKERFIHSEIYKRYNNVNSVVHSHSEAVIPYSIGSTPLRPVFHMGGIMGAQVPIFDIDLHYKSSDSSHSMLVSNEHLGAGLAAGLHPTTMVSKTASMLKNYITSSTPAPVDYPANPTVLMRGHGFTCVGGTIEDAVNRAVYTCTNARVQTTTLLMQGTFNLGLVAERFGAGEKETGPAKYEDIKYLSDREAKDTASDVGASSVRQWKLWRAEVENCSLYKNELESPPGA